MILIFQIGESIRIIYIYKPWLVQFKKDAAGNDRAARDRRRER